MLKALRRQNKQSQGLPSPLLAKCYGKVSFACKKRCRLYFRVAVNIDLFENTPILLICIYILSPPCRGRENTAVPSWYDSGQMEATVSTQNGLQLLQWAFALSCECELRIQPKISWLRKFYQMNVLEVKNTFSYFLRKYTYSYVVPTSFDKLFAAGKITAQGYFSHF